MDVFVVGLLVAGFLLEIVYFDTTVKKVGTLFRTRNYGKQFCIVKAASVFALKVVAAEP